MSLPKVKRPPPNAPFAERLASEQKIPAWIREGLDKATGSGMYDRFGADILQLLKQKNAAIESWICEQFAGHLVLEIRQIDDDEGNHEVYLMKCNGEYFGRPLKLTTAATLTVPHRDIEDDCEPEE